MVEISHTMSDKAKPYDNAKIESFFRTPKVEDVIYVHNKFFYCFVYLLYYISVIYMTLDYACMKSNVREVTHNWQ